MKIETRSLHGVGTVVKLRGLSSVEAKFARRKAVDTMDPLQEST